MIRILKYNLNALKKDVTEFNNDGFAQLDWIYKHSEHYEKAHLQYLVYRIL